jgi:hypothetical protein
VLHVSLTKLQYAKSAQKQLDAQLATRLNIIRDFVGPDENRITDIMADLLDPEGRHGQDRVFLESFLKGVQLPELVAEGVKSISRERFTNNGRRIDLLIEFESGRALAIENKPFAKDQLKQISDYCDELAQKFAPGYTLFYLTPSGQSPPSDSIEAGKRDSLLRQRTLRCISYRMEIVNWLESCVRECKAEKVRWLLRDFAEYVAEFVDDTA